MIGAIIGDIVGSRFEWNNIKTKDFTLFTERCEFTDDSILTLAIADALAEWYKKPGSLGAITVRKMKAFGRKYPFGGYGGMFCNWLASSNPKPYNSFGNGAAMRVSPVAYVGKSIEEVKALSKKVTEVTHNHPEGLKGAEATAVATFLALQGTDKDIIKEVIEKEYYVLPTSLSDIRDNYRFNETCQGTVPAALQSFFEAESFEDAIRNSISIGGDSDTLAAICGGVAGAFYEIPFGIKKTALNYLDNFLYEIIINFQKTFNHKFI